MAAIDSLTELVERAVVAEKVAVSSKWKERPDVAKLIMRVRNNAREQREKLTKNTVPLLLSSRWVSLRQDHLFDRRLLAAVRRPRTNWASEDYAALVAVIGSGGFPTIEGI